MDFYNVRSRRGAVPRTPASRANAGGILPGSSHGVTAKNGRVQPTDSPAMTPSRLMRNLLLSPSQAYYQLPCMDSPASPALHMPTPAHGKQPNYADMDVSSSSTYLPEFIERPEADEDASSQSGGLWSDDFSDIPSDSEGAQWLDKENQAPADDCAIKWFDTTSAEGLGERSARAALGHIDASAFPEYVRSIRKLSIKSKASLRRPMHQAADSPDAPAAASSSASVRFSYDATSLPPVDLPERPRTPEQPQTPAMHLPTSGAAALLVCPGSPSAHASARREARRSASTASPGVMDMEIEPISIRQRCASPADMLPLTALCQPARVATPTKRVTFGSERRITRSHAQMLSADRSQSDAETDTRQESGHKRIRAM
ncbi:hypothetical protein THASP1DRAFT_21868 [Thamnocephalis sphaerospora]|uniref:Uncharacterized protein n=1 Tax=Thamnocephalis sphaerospora TaxID=78915 RepID=A0A4P9XVV7_9FUNG|nr:hypothetical protein THASP1DRAFT_21868 [Thamnocephalis sphaerospora]|eukprot:RKP10424.1 hypothetical protein THASP1DRAFT_21868 [Thamnocephalis sphaerospora]